MSQRHRTGEVPQQLPKQEFKAQRHAERHRIHVQLSRVAQQVSAGVEPEDLHEPGRAWKPLHQRDAEVAKKKLAKRTRNRRHWKTKMWKRRTNLRRAKAQAFRLAGEG